MKKSKSITGIPYYKCLNILKNIEMIKRNSEKLSLVLSEQLMEEHINPTLQHLVYIAEIALNGVENDSVINYYLFDLPVSGGSIQHGRKKWKIDTIEQLADYICRKREKP